MGVYRNVCTCTSVYVSVCARAYIYIYIYSGEWTMVTDFVDGAREDDACHVTCRHFSQLHAPTTPWHTQLSLKQKRFFV